MSRAYLIFDHHNKFLNHQRLQFFKISIRIVFHNATKGHFGSRNGEHAHTLATVSGILEAGCGDETNLEWYEITKHAETPLRKDRILGQRIK